MLRLIIIYLTLASLCLASWQHEAEYRTAYRQNTNSLRQALLLDSAYQYGSSKISTLLHYEEGYDSGVHRNSLLFTKLTYRQNHTSSFFWGGQLIYAQDHPSGLDYASSFTPTFGYDKRWNKKFWLTSDIGLSWAVRASQANIQKRAEIYYEHHLHYLINPKLKFSQRLRIRTSLESIKDSKIIMDFRVIQNLTKNTAIQATVRHTHKTAAKSAQQKDDFEFRFGLLHKF